MARNDLPPSEDIPTARNAVSDGLDFQKEPQPLENIEYIVGSGVEMTPQQTYRLGRLTTLLSGVSYAAGIALMSSRHIMSGGYLFAMGMAGSFLAYATYEDAKDKRDLDQLGLPYLVRLGLDGSPHHD